MDNQKVRAHLRKGELAVNLLVGLGFTYDDSHAPKWVAPSSFVDMEQARKEMQAVLDKYRPKAPEQQAKEDRVCPVRVGTQFRIRSIPKGHFLAHHGVSATKVFEVSRTEYIERGSEASVRLKGFWGWAVHFEFESFSVKRRGLWLPLGCIKVTPDADF